MQRRAVPQFTTDWFSNRSHLWSTMFAGLRDREVHALEIGCWEGRASLWMLENVLNHPSSTLTVVDVFTDPLGTSGTGTVSAEQRFDSNVAAFGAKIIKLRGRSGEVVRAVMRRNYYSLIYVDGSHLAIDVLSDAVLAFPLLASGGFMAFDDYRWKMKLPAHRRPMIAIDAFISVFAEEMRVVHRGKQVIVVKK